jgi:hypothetical protein
MQPETTTPRHLSLEHEIEPLIHWSLPWINASAIASGVIAIQGYVFNVYLLFGQNLAESTFWNLLRSSSYVVLAIQLHVLFKRSKSFVDGESDHFLPAVKSGLEACWVGFAAIVGSTFAALVSNSVGGIFLHSNLELRSPFTILALPISILVPLGCLILLRPDPSYGDNLVKNLERFSARSLPRLLGISMVAFLGNVSLLLLWFFDKAGASSMSFSLIVNIFIWSVFGGGLMWFRHSLRDVKRNPTPIMFERTLNRLNMFWLAATACFVLVSIVSLAAWF